ncbi:ABC transporter permease [Peptoniphilus mikwangii]|uniref:ABC transporter permease n=1 Tax=Peptoniphilus mikwangii TaxID=1354300 RepID=UPI000426C89B|nr:FtsX-like permease family protein [Peptoniphilus mikwangii]
MKLKDLIMMALKNLNSRKLRTALTVLGVVIGATSIIVMLSIGFGFQKINTDMYKSMGDLTTLDLHTDMFWSDEQEKEASKKKKTLNDQAINEIKRIPHVIAIMPMYKASAVFTSGRFSNNGVDIVAIPADAMEKFGFKIGEGRLLNSQDNSGGVVMTFGCANENFRDDKRPYINSTGKIQALKSRIEIKQFQVQNSNNEYSGGSYFDEDGFERKSYVEKLKVVGVLEENPNDWSNYNTTYMTIEYFKKLKKASETVNGKTSALKAYSNIKVKVDDMENVDAVQKQIKDLGYNATNMYAEFLKQGNQQIVIIQAVFGAIGAISFLVAAIGITNTMIMSIYERTKEIGVMKVIGASIKDIEKLFLVEAGFIGLFGGFLGVISSLLLSALFNKLAEGFIMSEIGSANVDPKISYIPFWLILIALLFSTAIGVISGYLPARRAMKLSALEAIRSD